MRKTQLQARLLVMLLVAVLAGTHCKQDSGDEFDGETVITSLIAATVYPYLADRCPVNAASFTGPVSAISSGFGAHGPFTNVGVHRLQNPTFAQEVCVYYPVGATSASPTLFMLHGFSSPSAETYLSLINFAVSKGYVVVFPLYFSDGRDPNENYQVMFKGAEFATQQHGDIMDLTKVGFMGHSYGAGAVPWLTREFVVLRGMGSAGNFMYMMAPWYTFDMTDAQLQGYPANTRLITQVYEFDTVTDHRMAQDIFNTTNINNTEKDFQLIYSDARSGYNYDANHYVPNKSTLTIPSANDAHDAYGVWRQLDALADYTFNGNATAQAVALGDGATTQTFMGQYSDGVEVTRMFAGNTPLITQNPSFYSAPFTDSLNPRL